MAILDLMRDGLARREDHWVLRHQQLPRGNVWSNGRIQMAFANGAILEVEPMSNTRHGR